MSPLPIDVPVYEVGVSWTAANDGDAGMRWLVREMAAAFKGEQWDRVDPERKLALDWQASWKQPFNA